MKFLLHFLFYPLLSFIDIQGNISIYMKKKSRSSKSWLIKAMIFWFFCEQLSTFKLLKKVISV